MIEKGVYGRARPLPRCNAAVRLPYRGPWVACRRYGRHRVAWALLCRQHFGMLLSGGVRAGRLRVVRMERAAS